MINRVLIKLGLLATRRQTVRRYIEVEEYNEAIWSHYLQPIISVNISEVKDMFAFAFNMTNPLIMTLKQYENNHSLSYFQSALFDYYQSFQPESALDIFSDDSLVRKTNPGKGMFSYLLPWDEAPKTQNGSQLMYSGPMTNERGKYEFERLIGVYTSIKKTGYKPQLSANLFNSNHVQGYFLKSGNKYRFVILHGKHRTAALAALQRESIPVTFELGKPRCIDILQLDSWPQVRNGQFSKEYAEKIFNYFFMEEV